MPYLQVDLDALDEFAAVATRTGLTDGEVSIGLLRLWRYCFRAKTAHVTIERLATFFRGDAKVVAEALITCGFVDRPGDRPDLHVRGAEKRLGILKAQQEAGRKHAGNLKQTRSRPPSPPPGRPGRDPEVNPETPPGSYTQHPAPSTQQRESETTPPRSASQHDAARVETDRPSSDPRTTDLFAGLVAVWADEHPSAMRPDVPDVGSIRAFATEADPIPVPTLIAAYRLFLRDEHWRKAGWPWKAWRSQWKAKVTLATTPAVTAGHGGKVLRPVLEGA